MPIRNQVPNFSILPMLNPKPSPKYRTRLTAGASQARRSEAPRRQAQRAHHHFPEELHLGLQGVLLGIRGFKGLGFGGYKVLEAETYESTYQEHHGLNIEKDHGPRVIVQVQYRLPPRFQSSSRWIHPRGLSTADARIYDLEV